MTIYELQKTFKEDASYLGDYQEMSKTDLANGYCDAEEAAEKAKAEGRNLDYEMQETLRSSYFSALMLRYWFKIFEWAKTSSSLNLQLTDFVDWEYHAILYALRHKLWRVEGSAIYNDPNGPDKAINQCLGVMRAMMYQYYNKDKRKCNVTALSLDSMIDENGDCAINYAGAYVTNNNSNNIYCLITDLIDRGELLEALVVDSIAYYQSYKKEKSTKVELVENIETGLLEEIKYKQEKTKYDARKVVKHLNNINLNFIKNFCVQYSVNMDFGKKLYEKLKATPNPKLYKLIEKTLREIKETPDLLSYVVA